MEGRTHQQHACNVTFTTFGMFIVDEIEWQGQDSLQPKYDLIGGAGTYAILGARLVSGPQLSRSISWIVDVGNDFPPLAKEAIDSWNTDCVYRNDPNRKTTRAWNGYGANDFRAFKYLTPKLRLEVSSFSSSQLMAGGFHMVCSPERCSSIISNLQMERKRIDPEINRPIVIWEPIPDLCTPGELSNLQKAAKNCTIVSPNDDELQMFFTNNKGVSQEIMVSNFIGWTDSLLSTGVGTPAIAAAVAAAEGNELTFGPIPIVREGARGSTAYFLVPTPDHPGTSVISLHVNAYHPVSLSHQVIDPTGGGNTYLGALGISLTGALDALPATELIVRTFDLQIHKQSERLSETNQNVNLESWTSRLLIAMMYATIAASFAIEQNGVPTISSNCDGKTNERQETNLEKWNGDTLMARLNHYINRESAAINEQLTIAYEKLRVSR